MLGAPLAFVGLPLYMHLPKLYAEQFGISLAALGSLLLFLRMGDVVIDPLIGLMSDRFHRRRGRIMWVGALIIATGFAALVFIPDAVAAHQPLLWFGSFTAIIYLGYGLVYINYYALGTRLTHTPQDRTRLSTYREGMTLVGIMVAAALPSLLQQFLPALASFQLYAVVLAMVLFSALALCPQNPTPATQRSGITFGAMLTFIATHPDLRWIFVLFTLNALPTAISSTVFLFFADDVLHAEAQAGGFLMVYFGAAALSTLLWGPLAVRFGNRHTLMAAMLLVLAVFGFTSLLSAQNADWFYLICALAGIALGADMVLLPTMLANVLSGHERFSASAFAVWQAISKGALALAAGIVLPYLASHGYDPTTSNDTHATDALMFTYALLPCAIKVLALGCLMLSPLEKRKTS